MSDLRTRTQEINAEYWATRETQTERVAIAQLCLALARAEAAVPATPNLDALASLFRTALHVHCSPTERCSLPLHFEDDAVAWFAKYAARLQSGEPGQ